MFIPRLDAGSVAVRLDKIIARMTRHRAHTNNIDITLAPAMPFAFSRIILSRYANFFANACDNSFNVFKASGSLAIKLHIFKSTSVVVYVVVVSAF